MKAFRPIRVQPRPQDLERVRAAATVVGVRPAVQAYHVADTSPAMLGSLMAAADSGNSMAWQILATEIERRDLHYLGVLGTRKRTISQLPITVEPASESAEHKRHADFVREWIDTGLLQTSLFDALDAIGKGWSVLEIAWETKPGSIRPCGLTYRPQRWFEVSPQDGETIQLRSDTTRLAAPPPDVVGGYAQAALEDLDPYMFVVHRHPSYSGLTIASGLTRVVAWAWMFKSYTSRDWAMFVSNYGAPVRVGRYGPDASAEDRATLWTAVADIAGDCAAIIPKGMEIEFVQPPAMAAAGELHQKRCDWLDSQVSKAVLGQTATTDAHPGSHAAGRTHRLVQEDIERADCRQLEGTVQPQLVDQMVAFTFGEQDAYPRIRIGRPDDTPLTEVVTAMQWLGPQGLTVKASELREELGFSEPAPDDELVGGRAAPPTITPAEDLPPTDDPAVDRPGEVKPAKPGGDQVPPQPPGKPAKAELHAQIGELLERHVQSEGPHIVELMVARLAHDARSAIAGMTDAVREQVEAATSLEDLKRRLDRLKLEPAAFAAAMQAAMAVSELAGQASLLDEIGAG